MTRSRLLPVLVVVAVLTAVAWFALREPPASEGPPPREEADAVESRPPWGAGPAPSFEHSPILHLARGTQVIQGGVFQDGECAPARVTLWPARETGGSRAQYSPDAFRAPPGPVDPVAAIDTGPEGTFRFSGLGDGWYEVRAAGGSGGVAGTVVWRGGLGDAEPVWLELVPGGCTLTCRARHRDGTPFAGYAWVADRRGDAVRPDSSGRFEFEGLPRGPATISLLIPHHRLYTHRTALPREGVVEIVLDEGAEIVSGWVRPADDGAGATDFLDEMGRLRVEGATVVIMEASPGGSGRAVVRTNASGEFHALIGGERGIVTIAADGFAPFRGLWQRGDENSYRLVRRGTVIGKVLEAGTGDPVPGIPISVITRDAQFLEGPRRTDSGSGFFLVSDVGPGWVEVRAVGNGWVDEGLVEGEGGAARPFRVELDPGGRQRIDIAVVRCGRAKGRVLDATGQPVADVPVSARARKPRDWPGNPPAVVSGADGTFEVEGLVPGCAYFLTALPDSAFPSRSGPHTVEPGGTLAVDLTLARPRFLDVTVLEKGTGSPVVMAGVAARQSGRALHFQTDRAGRARVGPLGPDRVRITVNHGRYVCPRQPFEVENGAGEATIELERGAFLAGSVLEPDGSPFTGTIGLKEIHDLRRQYSLEQPGNLTDGRFRIGPLPAGRYVLVAGAYRGGRYHRLGNWTARAGDEDLRLTVDSAPVAEDGHPEPEPDHGELVVRIVGPDGAPISAGYVNVQSGDRSAPLTRTDSTPGRAVYRIHTPGAEVELEIWGAKGAAGEPLGAVLHGPVAVAAGEIAIRLPESRTIEGIARGPDGRGLRGVVIHAYPQGSRTHTAHSWTRTDAQGRFRLRGLGAGGYDLVPRTPPGCARLDPIPATSGSRDLEIRFAAGSPLRVRVVDSGGKPVRTRVTAVQLPEREIVRAEWTRTDGSATFADLDKGRTFDLRVVGNQAGQVGVLRDVPTGGEPVVIRTIPGGTLRGRITLPEGEWRIEALATLESSSVPGVVAEDRTFEIRGLTDEVWEVAVWAARDDERLEGRGRGRPGSRLEIELTRR